MQSFKVGVFYSVLLILLSCTAGAQSVSVTPESVGPGKSQTVTLTIKKPDGTIGSDLVEQVKTVTVGGKEVKIENRDARSITITAPQGLSAGSHAVELLGSDGGVLHRGQVTYQAKGSDSPDRDREQDRRDSLANSTAYYSFVAVMFCAVLFPFVLAIYRGTSGSQATGNRPLGLPTGSFRSILAYSLVVYLGFYVLTSVLSVSTFAPPEFLLGIVATVIGFYFGSRSQDEGGAAQNTGTVRGIVRSLTNPLIGTTVKFKRVSDGTEPYSRISDVEGRFQLTGMTPGKYKVYAFVAGSVASAEQEISIADGSDHEIMILANDSSSVSSAPTQTGVVEGTITKPDGTAATRANVALMQGNSRIHDMTADDTGKYKFAAVAPGEYEIIASLDLNTLSNGVKVVVKSGGRHSVDLKLK